MHTNMKSILAILGLAIILCILCNTAVYFNWPSVDVLIWAALAFLILLGVVIVFFSPS